MGKLLFVVATLTLAACQPMYGAPAQRIRDPVPNHPDDIAAAAPQPVIYDENCEVHTRAVTTPPRRDLPRSQALVAKADASAVASDHAVAPHDKAELLIDSIQEYGAALERDPYNAEATLKLALAYDKALRKGCALAMLDRLAKLANHPTYEHAATEQLDDLENHRTWFGGYRKDALRAAGRP